MRRVFRCGLAAAAGAATLALAVPAHGGPGMGWGQWTAADLTFGECVARAPAALRAEGLTKVEQYGRVWFGASPGPVSATIVCYSLEKGALVTIFAANEGASGPSGSLVGRLVDRVFKSEKPIGVSKPGTPKPAPAPTTSTPATSGAFARVAATKVANPNAPELKIDPAAGTATWDHCCDGGKWKVVFTWKVPAALTPGKPASLTLKIDVQSVEPSQTLLVQLTARAPDFAQGVSTTYPASSSANKTYSVPISAGYASAKDLSISIQIGSAEVVYTYHRGS